MRSRSPACCALRTTTAVLLLAGCGAGSGTPLIPAPLGVAAVRTHPTGRSYGLLYFFGGAPDGGEPYSDLINVDQMLYGTTYIGGMNDSGSVFTVTRSGKEAVLYSFKGRSGDGAFPIGGLLNVNGTLYGTTAFGGAGTCYDSGFPEQCGTVFAITKSGRETVLHRFGVASGDGTIPFAGLINVKGTLYGTTTSGGANGLGTVFTMTKSGNETVRYSFKPAREDGAYPYARLIDVSGALVGTTLEGGTYGAGTVFSISGAGKERVLHSFGGPHDGAFPYDNLLNVNGTLYGTTSAGGASRGLQGTVFSMTRSGKESVLHSFAGSGDGANPVAGLIDVKGSLLRHERFRRYDKLRDRVRDYHVGRRKGLL